MQVAGQAGMPGVLDLRKANREHWGNSLQARLLAIKNLETDVLPVLQYARVLTIKEGGVMVDGFEISARGAKSKPIKTRQTWWCVGVAELEIGYAALERMNPKCSTGFSVNDDDEEDLLPAWPR
ncbi:hypothetical protein [Variovorax paradoxus]|uniref:Uncharacterized protein n=1 Tax=Variovorax paradoxus TaxID=34073 RepID=A0A6I6HJ94_VARPD|nr:hypothetical protein [Variovorax paradoxus]QGW82917.1 hypothetical protein GOQ09_15635 [Variovorax paradoxus]